MCGSGIHAHLAPDLRLAQHHAVELDLDGAGAAAALDDQLGDALFQRLPCFLDLREQLLLVAGLAGFILGEAIAPEGFVEPSQVLLAAGNVEPDLGGHLDAGDTLKGAQGSRPVAGRLLGQPLTVELAGSDQVVLGLSPERLTPAQCQEHGGGSPKASESAGMAHE